MGYTIIDIPWAHVGATTILIIAAGACSLYLRLGLGRDLLVGTLRTFLQLFLLGYVLKIVFDIRNVWVILLLFVFMIIFAAITITGRVKEKRIPYFLPVLASIFLSYTIINLFTMAVIIQVKPWYQPMYFIPIGGMIIGNSMNALAIAINSWFEGIKKERDRIELYLSLGGSPSESTLVNYAESVRAGMIPSINALMTVGVVFIPGMMTGQILAGIDPFIAIKYQIVIMLLLVGSTAVSTVVALHIVRRLTFTPSEQLRV
jgi:putative ABC transport system permease protein